MVKASVALLKVWLVQREEKSKNEEKKRAACLASYAFASAYAEGEVPKTSRKHVAKYVGWLKPTS